MVKPYWNQIVPGPNTGPVNPKPATEAPDGSNHVSPFHLQPIPELRSALEKFTKSNEQVVTELRAMRALERQRMVNTNVAKILRVDLTTMTPQIFTMRTELGDIPALSLACIDRGTGGDLQFKTAEMGDADFISVTGAGSLLKNEELEQITFRVNPAFAAGTGTAKFRVTGWRPPAREMW